MDDIEFIQVQRMLNSFSRALDEGDFQKVASQMTPDGIWHRQGERLQGHKAVLAALARRPADLVTRHLVTNVEVRFVSAERATARSTVLVFRHEGPVESAAPMSLPHSVLDYDDDLVKQDGRWQIAERRSRRIFSK
jgi:uncharacterized protein (TIGR02246 family)